MSMSILVLTDDYARQLKADGWIIKSPDFINGQPVFRAIKRG
ncbi:hypothetical protein NH8B_0581 [Pseudogulbenkiania sp. NH8B]|nr:hypothetical protein [Pseudogulbenkiania sp. NH8B]BAK75416.1 hypothetical protein NH8B_0581 [Pseudogulbenkiania sp. NH8B]